MSKLVFVIVAIAALASSASAQEESRGEVRATAGIAEFPDDSWLHHNTAGGSASLRVSSRFLVGAEVLYMAGPKDDRDIAVVPLLQWEVGRFNRVQPYLIGGVGLLRNRQRVGTGLYWSNSATYGAGAGVKVRLGANWFLSPEIRVGWEPLVQSSIGIGYRF